MELNSNNYYSLEANQQYFSASQIKGFLDCEAETLAEINGAYKREQSQSLLIGSYIDAYFEGTIEQFAAEHPEVFNSRTGELKANFQKANDMVARAQADKLFMDYMEGDKQVIKTGKIDGFDFKCKYDVYVPHKRIVDLKTVKDFEPLYKDCQGRLDPIQYWYWDLQLAIYQQIEFYNTGELLPCYLAIITKEEPADIRIVHIPDEMLKADIQVLKDMLPRFDAIKQGIIEPKRCEKCAFCRGSKVLTEPEEYSIWEV